MLLEQLKGLKKALWMLSLCVLISVAAIQIVFRVVFASASHYQEQVTQLVSAALHKPVKIEQLHATWHGLQPVFKMRGVSVFDVKSKHLIAQIDHVRLGVDLIDSLRKKRWIPGELMLSGVDLHIALNRHDQHQQGLLTFFDELLSSGDKVLNNINVSVTLPKGQVRRFTHINAMIKNAGDHHRIRGVVHLDGKQSVSVIADAYGSVLEPKHFHGQVYLREKEINLAAIQQWLPSQFRHLTGRVDQEVWFTFQRFSKLTLTQTNGVFHDLCLPEVKHLSGQFWVTPHQARVRLHSRAVQVDYPALWPSSFIVSQLQATLNWQHDVAAQIIKVPTFHLQANGLNLAGHAALVLQDHTKSPQLDVTAHFDSDDIGQLKRYYPTKVMPKKLSTWLRSALVSGKASDGKIRWQGSMNAFPYANGRGRIELSTNLSGATLRYATNWPVIDKLDGRVALNNQRFRFVAHHGRILQQSFSSANASIDDLRENVLRVNTRIKGAIQHGLALVHNSPLEKTVGKELAPLHLSGPMLMNLHMRWPLKKDKHALHVLGDVQLLGNQLDLPDWNLSLNALRGRFQFSETGVQSQQIQSRLYGLPLNLRIQTQHPENESFSHTVIDLKGRLSHQLLPSLDAIKGDAPFHAQLILRRLQDAEPDHFHLATDLQGMALWLPKPLQKQAAERIPLSIDAEFSARKPTTLKIDYHHDVHVRAKLLAHQLQALSLGFGSDAPVELSDHATRIAGELAQLNVSDWTKLVYRQGGHHDSIPPLTYLDLHVNKLVAFEQMLPQVKFALTSTAQSKTITVRSRQTNGEIIIPQNQAHHAITATFDRLHCRTKKHHQRSLLRVQDLPPLNITINDFSFEELPLGRFQLSITPEQNTLRINALSFKSKLMSLSLTGHWRQYQDHHDTVLSGAMYTHNLGRMLNVFDLTSNMIKGDGRAVFKLAWDDSLVNFATNKLNGRLRFRFTGGQIVELGEQTATQLGLGRVLNLFSLQTIPRRLSLDFSDLTREGFAFDHLSGDFVLRDGDALSKNAKIKGPVAEVTMRGRLGLAAKDYQLELAITPHVTSSLPVVAAVAGGPAAGMATWVVEKLFSRAVNKATTVMYRVEGPWEHPKFVKLRRLVRAKRV